MKKYILYISNRDILVHTENRVIRLKCPFKVKSKSNFNNLEKDKIYLVNIVKSSEDHKLIFNVNNNYYKYDLFEILLSTVSHM